MFKLLTWRSVSLTFTLVILVTMALSGSTFAKNKQGRGRFNDRKADKFINGHDARDGRWDGRGPRDRFRHRRDHDDFRREEFRRAQIRRAEFRREHFRRAELRREQFRREQFRRAQFRRDEWRQNELRRRRVLPGRSF